MPFPQTEKKIEGNSVIKRESESMYEVIKLQIKTSGQYALLPTPFQGSFINPKPLTAHKHSNYHGSTTSFLRLHLESLQVSQLHLLPWLASAPTTCYITTATVSYHSHDSPIRPRPWASWLSEVGLIKLLVSRDQAASSPRTFLREAFLVTLLSAQLNTKDALPSTPNVLPTFASQ